MLAEQNEKRFTAALNCLCKNISRRLLPLAPKLANSVQEIRLRLSRPLALVCPDNTYYLTQNGGLSNTILDGNGHKLVKAGNLPDFGIAFFYIDKSSGPYKMVYSSNAGVINLKSDLEYAQETVNIMGADRVYLANNEFKNA